MFNSIDKVYFDVNGVLLDFDKSVEKYSNISKQNFIDLYIVEKEEGEDPVKNIFSKYLKKGLISNAPVVPEFRIFYEMIQWLNSNHIEVEFLCLVYDMEKVEEIESQYKIWFAKNNINKAPFFMSSSLDNKRVLSEPNALLIDDSEKACELFNYQGSAIHHNSIYKTLENFKSFFPDFEIRKNKNLYQSLINKSVLSQALEEY